MQAVRQAVRQAGSQAGSQAGRLQHEKSTKQKQSENGGITFCSDEHLIVVPFISHYVYSAIFSISDPYQILPSHWRG